MRNRRATARKHTQTTLACALKYALPMRCTLLLLVAAAACQGTIDMKVPPVEPKAPTRVDGALTTGSAPARSELGMTDPGQQLALLGGALAVAGAETLYRFDAETSLLGAVPVGDVGEPMTTGPVRHLARRGSGLFVVAEGGIFHDASGRLLRSPLSDSIAAIDIAALDDLGEGEAEELWLTTASGVERIKAGIATGVAIDFESTGTADLAVGVEKDQGLLLSGGNLFWVDLATRTAKWEAKALPPVTAAARGDDGTVYLATRKGLYARGRSGELKLYSFTAAGEEPRPVTDVTVAYGEVLVAVDGAVAQLSATGASAFGTLVAPRAHGLTRDANGNTFMLDGAALVQLATGASHAVSFAADVAPFFIAHCTTCHATGANYSPVFDLTSYAVASEPVFNAKIIQRLTASGKPPMPPSDVEVLTSSDYAVVLKWVAGGKQP